MTAKTNSERIAEFRARKKAAGLTEVRNLFAPPQFHDQIKKYAARLRKPKEQK